MLEYKAKYRRPFGTQWEEHPLDQAMERIADRIIETRPATWEAETQDGHPRIGRSRSMVGSAVVLTGELLLRWSVFKAGFASARDPRYTVLPRRERAANRASEAK